jgi:hypothetical protein
LGGEGFMKNASKDVTPKKAYVKPTVVKHAAATQIVGSCGEYVSSGCAVASVYYY